MIVRPENGTDPVDIGIEQLIAQIRRRIDQQSASCFVFDQDRHASAPVLGLVGVAAPPIVADSWHSGGRSAA